MNSRNKLPQINRTQSQGMMKPQIKGLDFNSPNNMKQGSLKVRNLVNSVRSCIQYTPSLNFAPTFQKDIHNDKKELEKLRLQDDSQNTRLLKIQQKERNVNEQYQSKKKKMEETLETLASQAEQFNEQQRNMNEELEEQKTNIVIKQDNKREKEQEIKKRDEQENKKKQETLKEQKKKIEELNVRWEELRKQQKQLQQYDNFLNEVMRLQKEGDKNEEQDKSVNSIIERFKQMKKESEKFLKEQKEMELEQDEIKKEIQSLNTELQLQHLQHTSDLNSLKSEIDKINQKNAELLVTVDSKFSDQRGKHLDYGQIYFGINNLYYEYIQKPNNAKKLGRQFANEKKQDETEEEGKQQDTTQLLLYRLDEIERHLNILKDIKRDFNQEAKKHQQQNQ